MIRRLRRSFVTITMISAALVLVILMGVVNLTNYFERTSSDKELLSYLAENGGRFPQNGKGTPDGSRELSASEELRFTDGPDSGPETDGVFFEGRGSRSSGRHITVETPYETRYYSVFLATDGQVGYVDTTQIAAVSGEEAAETAQSLQSKGKTSGRYGHYRFTTVETDTGVLFIFLDCNRNILAFRSFLLDSVIVTIAGLAVLFLIARLLSGRAVRPIAESYEKQKSFITNAGHELKTPLAVIESSTEVIEIESGESQWTRQIHGQVERLSRLTQQLVALARMDEGTSALELTETDVSKIVSDALEPFALLAEQAGHGFRIDIPEGLRGRTNADALEKICAILADNAVKYASGDISFCLRSVNGHIVLTAENPAEGLAAGKQEKLFDRFYRADASRSSEQPGYGLGLPLARSLAEAMGGRMTAESPDGQTLQFTVQL